MAGVMTSGVVVKERFLSDALRFLHTYQWVYDFKVTEYMLQKVWQNIPAEWTTALLNLTDDELNNLPFSASHTQLELPESLHLFLSTAESLNHLKESSDIEQRACLPTALRTGMNPKKQHEVERLASLVDSVCKSSDCHTVVDVGSGLGYVGQVLSSEYGLSVLGLEGNAVYSHTATNRALQHDIASSLFKSVAFELKEGERCIEDFRAMLHQYCVTDVETMEAGSDVQFLCSLDIAPVRDSASDDRRDIDKSKLPASSKSMQSRDSLCQVFCNSEVEEACALSKTRELSTEHSSMPLRELDCGSRDVSYAYDHESHSQEYCPKDEPRDDMSSHSTTDVMAYQTPHVCLLGLHACGDLTPLILRIFSELSEVNCLVCLGCCYHRMTLSQETLCTEGAELCEQGSYKQFPLSQKLRKISKDLYKEENWKMSSYGLRLAAQETRARWVHQTEAEHEIHKKNVAYRGILEVFLKNKGTRLKKFRRKLVTGDCFDSFDAYVQRVLERADFEGELNFEETRRELMKLHSEYMPFAKYVEIFTCLQLIIQPVIETLILNDRILYLQEQGFPARLVSVFDQNISPRNMAIVAFKPRDLNKHLLNTLCMKLVPQMLNKV